MQSLSPTVVLLGSFARLPLESEAIRLENALALPETLDLTRIDVLAADLELLSQKWLADIVRCQSPRFAQIITRAPKDPTELVRVASIHNELHLHTILSDEAEAGKAVYKGIEKAQQLRQKHELQKLMQQQGTKLRSETEELERRAEKRRHSLVETRRKNVVSKYRWETLKKSLEAIHRSFSVSEIEVNLSRVLQETMNLVYLRISFQNHLGTQTLNRHGAQIAGQNVHAVTLFRSHENPIGQITFYRDRSTPFVREEKEFLARIAEAVSLAIDRAQQLELAESFREQWRATFNAVSDPVALIDQDFRVLQANSSFNRETPEASAKKCYERLFDRTQPCPGCRLGAKFRMTDGDRTIQVFSQKALAEAQVGQIYVNHYQDISDQIRIERRLAESAKLAELGTIGSSIAHELNNPLGGLLSYLQLIRMDLPKNDPMLPDLVEMEKGALRCRDIIQNLLGFTRVNTLEGAKELDLRKVIAKVCGILDLQFKSRGMGIRFHEPADPVLIKGHLNLLAQAFLSLIQGHFVRTAGKLPQLEISVVRASPLEVQIFDIGPEAQAPTDIQNANISISQQIFKDHGGVLEFASTNSEQDLVGRFVKITFTR